jgi:hypothetical protein
VQLQSLRYLVVVEVVVVAIDHHLDAIAARIVVVMQRAAPAGLMPAAFFLKAQASRR